MNTDVAGKSAESSSAANDGAGVSRFVDRCARLIFLWRLPLLIMGVIVTAFFAWSATRLQLSSGFYKMLPAHHEFMDTFSRYRNEFGGADKIMIAIQVKDGDIFQKDVIELIQKVTDEVFYVDGVDRNSITSLTTTNVRYNEVVEEGFRSGRLVPGEFFGTQSELKQIRENVLKSDWIGRIVSDDMSATMVVASLSPTKPGSGEPLDLIAVGKQLEKIRGKFENDRVSLHIIGFAKATADIAGGASSVLVGFLIAFVITAVLLYFYSGSLMLSAWALIVALLPVIWLLGFLPMVGLGLDPMSILVPFLIFIIGVSHAVQMTKAWKLETLRGCDGVLASHNCFRKLFMPGITALAANALAFATIAVVDIEVVRELAFTLSIGVTGMILTNKILLPILLSYMRFSSKETARLQSKQDKPGRIWDHLGWLTTPVGAIVPLSLAVLMLGLGLWKAQDLKIGDMGKGVPELRADSRYNQDVTVITDKFAIGVDLLQVIAEIHSDEETPCVKREIQEKIERFDFLMRQTEGVAAVRSLPGFINQVTQEFAEGWYKWRMLPETVPQIAQGVGMSTRLGNEYLNSGCTAIPISIYTTDHQATTISHIIDTIKAFKAENDSDELVFRLASGNIGVMAATNEVVERSELLLHFTVFASLGLMCLIMFRSLRITLCVVLPALLVTLLCNALMAVLGIGVKVNTLPVIAIAVGVGIDYGIYLFERAKHEMAAGYALREAFILALRERGSASLFTAVTMSLSVATWMFSTLKFQADMGVLLAFMFVVNLFGAILLGPALAAFLIGSGRKPAVKE
ncbi:MMPL family transporter [Pseudomonas sp. R3.Fl]|uniref:efflux RND transporter permease subunit n=1 Tax=Pseudomonas sp. R3.Fl TaxID=2928708 RepID=UPI00201DAB49|nr:MMPL family transporter [Pseudomonas sp. R3.Fl]